MSAHDNFSGEVHRMMLPLPMLADVDLEGIQEVVREGHTIGPFLDPTKYRDTLQSGHMDDAAELARLLEPAIAYWKEHVAPKLVELRSREETIAGVPVRDLYRGIT